MIPSMTFITAMQDVHQTKLKKPTHVTQRPTMRTNEAIISVYLLPCFFFPSIIPANFLPNASLTLLCPCHSSLIRFIRQLATTMKPTARNEALFFSVLPILPRRLSPRRRRGDEGDGVMPISERRSRSTWLLCDMLAWFGRTKEGGLPSLKHFDLHQ